MTFATPELLWLLLAPVALLVWELTHRRRSASHTRPKILRAEAGAHSLKLQPPTSTGPTANASRVRYWLFAGTSLAVLALARPQYGRIEEPVFDQSREILLAIDLSRSMLAPDVKPSRLDRAKLLIQSLLEKLEGERVGLVVFAGTAFLQSPLSADYEILREFLPALGPEFLPQGGSNYGALLDASLQAFSATNSADRFLVILSDGEATDEDWKKRLDDLKAKNIRVLGLGVGTPGGAMIPDGSGGFAKDERGAVVLSKLESATLQELATTTNGAYRDASGWIDLAALVKETVEAGQKGQFLEKNTVRLAERFQWPLAIGLWCLLISFYSEFPVRPRPRDIKLPPHARTAPPVLSAPRPLSNTVASLALCSLVLGHWALAIIPPGASGPTAKSGAPSAAGSADPAAPAPSAALSKIIGRLATSDNRTARDWAELGRETVTWGSQLQSSQQPIPEGPVRDALSAVDAGSKLDPKTADWPKLREELEALLKKSEEQKQEQQKQDNKDKQDQQDQQDKNQQDKDQKNQDQKKQDQQQQSKDQKDSQQEKSDEQKKQDQQSQDQKDDQQKQGESAFGDMKKNEQPPPPPPDPGTQKVGGQPEKKESEQQPADPSLALPLQKLEQLRNQDSPAHLFQLMEGEKKPGVKTKGKDW